MRGSWVRSVVALVVALPACAALFGPYDEIEAKKWVTLSMAAYCPVDTIAAWSCESCLPGMTAPVTLVTDEETDGRAYVSYWQPRDLIVVSFRGTVATSLRNWLSDLLSANTVQHPLCSAADCHVGEGFLSAYARLQPGVRAQLAALRKAHPSAHAVVTGHSLGAALAAMCAVDIVKNQTGFAGLQLAGMSTVGQPRVGNSVFSQWFSGAVLASTHVWRLTHYHDIVPHMPPERSGYFRHIPREVWYPNEQSDGFRECDPAGEDPTCADSWEFPVLTYSTLEDHLHYLNITVGDYGKC